MKFVDTNIFLRYLTGDDERKAQACFNLFQRVKVGQEKITTCQAVMTEIVYVLSSRQLYNLSPADIATRLRPIILLKGFYLPNKRMYLRALDIYANYSKLDFEDALIAAYLEKEKYHGLYSYDRGFDELSQVKRVEP